MRSAGLKRLFEQGRNSHPQIQRFREDMVLHERFLMAIDEVAARIQFGGQQSMTAVVGPTGAGKTAFAKEFCYQFNQYSSQLPAAEQPTLLYLELAAAESASFNWREDFYLPVLRILREPCIGHKIDIEQLARELSSGNTASVFSGRPRTLSKYREIMLKAFERCNTVAVLIDEADHFRRPLSRSGIFRQYDSLKSRSNSTSTHFVLLGTTSLRDIFEQSGQISRRVYPVWLTPYSDKELTAFGAAAAAIIEKLPIPITFALRRAIPDLYENCFGLFGILHDWFERALIKAFATNRPKITWSHMLESRLHEMQLSAILSDVIDAMTFQQRYREITEQKRIFLLGHAAPPARLGNRNPGVRLPKRDFVPA